MTQYGVLWDMDGVLADTGPFHYESWKVILREMHIDLGLELFKATFGMNNTGTLSAIYGHPVEPQLVEEIAGRKEALFRQMIHGKLKPLPGVLEWLERFNAWECKQAVASSAPMANVDALTDEMNLRPYFCAIVSGAGMPGKPAPDVFLKAAGEIGIPPAFCLVVEDAMVGIEAARSAGMRSLAVTTTNSAQALAAADLVVDRLDDLSEDQVWSLFKRSRVDF